MMLLTGNRAIDLGIEIGEAFAHRFRRALGQVRTNNERQILVAGAIGAPLQEVAHVFAHGDPAAKDRRLFYMVLAALIAARFNNIQPGDPDPIEAATADYQALVAAGRMPPLDGGGA